MFVLIKMKIRNGVKLLPKLKMAFFVDGYPTNADPSFAFVRPLILQLADRGFECTVIAPQSITNMVLRGKRKKPFRSFDVTGLGNEIEILRPSFVSVSKLTIAGVSASALMQRKACIRAYKRLGNQDVVYGHFWKMGSNAAVATGGKIPVFVASGESSIESNLSFTVGAVRDSLKESLAGVIYVSRKNKVESCCLGLASLDKSFIVAPNGFDESVFYPIEKKTARQRMGFDENGFTVIFVGAFNERKGVMRVAEALNRINDVNSIFIGAGGMVPNCDNIKFMGKVPHEELANYLNCADCFVLPTLAEGCCNAIVEALACGLPVISSNLPFNDDILDNKCSIRIDPNSVDDIVDAISLLKSNEDLRKAMSEAALRKASDLSIGYRADRIARFIRQNLKGVNRV